MKESTRDNYKKAYFVVGNTSDDMVSSAKKNFEQLRRQSEEFIDDGNIRKLAKKLYRAIGPQRLVLVRSTKARVKID